MVTMLKSGQDSVQDSVQVGVQNSAQDSVQNSTPLNKLNKTKLNKEERKVKKKKDFLPPSLEEVQNYIKDSGLNVDAKKFLDYFTATNWVDSKGNKVKSWKGKLQTWDGYNKNTTSNKLDNSNIAQFGDFNQYYANI